MERVQLEGVAQRIASSTKTMSGNGCSRTAGSSSRAVWRAGSAWMLACAPPSTPR